MLYDSSKYVIVLIDSQLKQDCAIVEIVFLVTILNAIKSKRNFILIQHMLMFINS